MESFIDDFKEKDKQKKQEWEFKFKKIYIYKIYYYFLKIEQIGEQRLNLNSSRQQGLSSIYNTPFQV